MVESTRPQRRSLIPATTALLHRNAVVRFASSTARQSSPVTSSSGLPTCPATPPAQLTRMSTGPRPPKKAATAAGADRSAVSLSTPCTVAPSRRSASAIPAPMPCAVPVTTAVFPARPPLQPRPPGPGSASRPGGPCQDATMPGSPVPGARRKM